MHLMRVMFPTVVILGLAGIAMGILNSYNHFTLPALAPIVWNLVIIGVVIAFSADYGFEALAWGVLIGTVFELLMQVPAVWKRRWKRGRPGLEAGGPAPSTPPKTSMRPLPTVWHCAARRCGGWGSSSGP